MPNHNTKRFYKAKSGNMKICHPFHILKNLHHNVSGATAIEYGLIAAFMTLIMIGSISQLGDTNNAKWNDVASKISNAHE